MGVNIDGVVVVDLEAHSDARGSFVEFYRESWLPTDHSALQGNISRSVVGTLRAMHFHRRQWDYWSVLSGDMFVALFDLRAGSPSERVSTTMRLSGETPRGLFIPHGVAHGFLAESELVFAYLVDRYFDGTDEWEVAWNDPALGIEWPIADPILSDRDRNGRSLAEALRDPVPFTGPMG
jgi:dTDP-4-dehydrorhamnose 3,5-epimerase